MVAIFLQSQLLGGTGNCHLLVMLAGLDEIQQITFVQVSSLEVLLKNKISSSVFKVHSIHLVTEVGRNPGWLWGNFIKQPHILLSFLH